MKKLAWICIALLMVFAFSACNQNNEETAESSTVEFVPTQLTLDEAKTILTDLIPKGKDVYSYFLSGGLPADIPDNSQPVGDATQGAYYPVISDKFKSTDDLRAYTESIFTKEFAEETFYKIGFEGSEEMAPLYIDEDDVLKVNINSGGFGWGTEILLDTAELVYIGEDEVVIEAQATIYGQPYDPMEVSLKNVDGVWLLNSAII